MGERKASIGRMTLSGRVCFLLCPSGRVRSLFKTAYLGPFPVWSPSGPRLVGSVPRSVSVRVWVTKYAVFDCQSCMCTFVQFCPVISVHQIDSQWRQDFGLHASSSAEKAVILSGSYMFLFVTLVGSGGDGEVQSGDKSCRKGEKPERQ